jgi:hypothetical protein
MTTCNLRRVTLSAAVALALSLSATSVFAQAEDQAAARSLFEEGKQLMKDGQVEAACPKLEAANKLYKSAGILLNLADCHARIGRNASAWTEFGEAASVANRTNRPEDAEEALRRKSEIEPLLSYLVITVKDPVAGLSVLRDGAPIAQAAWGAKLPVDAGLHELRAEAPGYEAWSQSIEVKAQGEALGVEVPALVKLPDTGGSVAGDPLASSDSGAPSSGDSKRTSVVPWVLIGAGAAVGIGGGVLMLIQSSNAAQAREDHDPGAYDDAKTPWTIGLVGVALGAASAATGVVLLTTGAASERGAKGGTWVSVSTNGVKVGGAF